MNKVTLYLMNKKGLTVLRTLVDIFGPQCIEEVVVGRDKGVDNDYSQDIIDFCCNGGIKWYDRIEYCTHSGYAIAIGWRWILNPEKLIVMHDSCLPQYRGFAPLPNMLINGENYIAVTALFAGDGSYDTGPIIYRSIKGISYPMKIEKAIDDITELYSEVSKFIVEKIVSGEKINSTCQNESSATYSVWRDEEDYNIDWSKDSKYIKRFVDAVGYPYKGAKTTMRNNGTSKVVTIYDVEEVNDVIIMGDRPIGKVIFMNKEKPTVVCGTGLVRVEHMVDYNTGGPVSVKFRTRFGE